MTCLKVGEHTILEARKHADMYGPEYSPSGICTDTSAFVNYFIFKY
ncbi:1009_t:CDS:2 [Entrophospora sp. SA101]|nr:1009_t:CDS:2 [Entrophospora sp. SA101]